MNVYCRAKAPPAKPRPFYTCKVCEQPFQLAGNGRDGKVCRDPGCRSEMSRRASLARKGISIPPPPSAQIQPIYRGVRTVLQPCIGPYLASLAAALPTRTD